MGGAAIACARPHLLVYMPTVTVASLSSLVCSDFSRFFRVNTVSISSQKATYFTLFCLSFGSMNCSVNWSSCFWSTKRAMPDIDSPDLNCVGVMYPHRRPSKSQKNSCSRMRSTDTMNLTFLTASPVSRSNWLIVPVLREARTHETEAEREHHLLRASPSRRLGGPSLPPVLDTHARRTTAPGAPVV